ncbi:MAG: hypothetical protein IKW60_04525 [Clostridia bacterium]|nr:hypothetical protein [Clostridia bacterium]
MKKQLISLLLTVVMVMSLVPMMATAEVTTDDFRTNYTKYGWSESTIHTTTGVAAAAEVTNADGFIGEKSLRVTVDHTNMTTTSTWDQGICLKYPRSCHWTRVDGTPVMDEGVQYSIKMYVKSNNSVPTEKLLETIYVGYAQWSFAKVTDSVISNGSFAPVENGDGWYLWQGTLTMPSGKGHSDLQIRVSNATNIATTANGAIEADLKKLDVLIDGIEIKDIATGEKLIGDRWGSFEENPVDATADNFVTNYAKYPGWRTVYNALAHATRIYESRAEVTKTEAISGASSLHVDFEGSTASNQGYTFVNNYTTSYPANKTYVYTFYTKGMNVKESKVEFGPKSAQIKLSGLTMGTNYTVEDAEDGWKKFVVTHTPTADSTEFWIGVRGTDAREFYIDNFTVTEQGSNVDLLGGGGDFEPTPVATPTPTPTPEPTATPEPTPTPTPVPTATPDLSMYEIEDFADSAVYKTKYGWSSVAEDPMATGDVQAATATVTNQAAYQGEKSLRVTLDHSGFTTSNTWQKGINFTFPRKFDAVAGEQYKITAYVKSNNSVPTEKLVNTIYFRYAEWSWVRMLNTETGVSNATNTAMDNGWYKIEGIITAPSGKTAQHIQVCVRNAKNTATAANRVTDSDLAKLDLFIDGISAVDLATGEEILGGRWGNFEDNYDIPDLTAVDFATNYAKYGSWRTVYKPLAIPINYENRAQVTNKEAASGNASLHVEFVGSTSNVQGFTFVNNYSTYTAGKTYVYTFYTKGLNVKDGIFTFGTKEEEKRLSQLTLGTDYTVTDAGNGWKKFVVNHTLTKDGTEFWIGSKGVDVRDFYLDNFTVTEQGSSVDLLGGAGNFELATTEDYTAVKPRLFDAKNQELTTLDATFGGKTITAASAVVNHNLTESKNAQMIVCLYDGLEIVKTWLPDEVTITTSDTSKDVKTEITLPTLTDSEDYKLKVFVWDGFSKMNPLVDFVEFDI